MLRNLVTDLLREGRIQTTDCRAKEVRREAEKMITLAKRGDLHARRQALAYIFDESVVTKLFDEIAPNMPTGTAATRGFSNSDLVRATTPKSYSLSWYSDRCISGVAVDGHPFCYKSGI